MRDGSKLTFVYTYNSFFFLKKKKKHLSLFKIVQHIAFINRNIFYVSHEAILLTVPHRPFFTQLSHCPLSIRSLRAGNVRYRLKVWKKNERGSGYFI